MARCSGTWLLWPFGRKSWFETKFFNLCQAHDFLYMNRIGRRVDADISLFEGIVRAGHPILACMVYVVVRSPFGWYKWWRR